MSDVKSNRSSSQIYWAVDFEACDDLGTWWSAAFVVAEYPSGRVLDRHIYVCDRQSAEFRGRARTFWDQHSTARKWLCARSEGSPAEVEVLVVDKFQELARKYPTAFLVSNHPGFDLGLLDAMLVRNNCQRSALRQDGRFLQSVCTWSFRLALKPWWRAKRSRPEREVHQLAESGTRHCPDCDCARLLAEHFEALDLQFAIT